MGRIHLPSDSDKWGALVNAVMNLRLRALGYLKKDYAPWSELFKYESHTGGSINGRGKRYADKQRGVHLRRLGNR
jgi:hypothetical protein